MIGGVVVVWTQSAPITDKMVTSQYVVQLVPYVKGQVKTIHAEANQRVKKGDLLLEIDPAPYQYTVNQVEAQLAASKANVKQAEAALATAKTAIPNAQAILAKAKAADELAKTQEQIALNIQRADKAAISQLNVAKASQERRRRTPPFNRPKPPSHKRRLLCNRPKRLCEQRKAAFRPLKHNWMTRGSTWLSAR